MAQRYVLSPLNTSNANNMSRGDDSILSKHSSRKELNSSMHSLSRTKSPTRLSSKAGNDPHRSVPVEKYEQLVIQCNELTKAASLLRVERDQYLKGYHDLKFISEREKIQLCQAFEELKVSYIQLQNKLQATTQENSMRRTPSSIEKVDICIIEALVRSRRRPSQQPLHPQRAVLPLPPREQEHEVPARRSPKGTGRHQDLPEQVLKG